MAKRNAENERVKRRYRHFKESAEGASPQTIAHAMAALARFEASTGWRSFRQFHTEQARAFTRRLQDAKSETTGEPLSVATVHGICKALEAFIFWLASEPGFRSRLKHSDAKFFRLTRNQVNAAKAPGRARPVPTLAQIDHVLQAMPTGTDVEKRNRALVALAILTGARDGALASAQVRHVDLGEGVFRNDGRTMTVKFGKVFETWFFPVSELALQIVTDWVTYIREILLFAETDPLFPATRMGLNPKTRHFEPAGLTRDAWSSAQPVRDIFRRAFEAVQLPYANPHSFRNTLAEVGRQLFRNDVEGLQAWAQNLGHESLLTTLTSYGKISPQRQADIIRTAGRQRSQGADDLSDETIQRMLTELTRRRRNAG